MTGWVTEWVSDSQSDRMSQWQSECQNESVTERVSNSQSDRMSLTLSQNESVTEWVSNSQSDRMTLTESVTEWACERVGEWEWVSDRVTRCVPVPGARVVLLQPGLWHHPARPQGRVALCHPSVLHSRLVRLADHSRRPLTPTDASSHVQSRQSLDGAMSLLPRVCSRLSSSGKCYATTAASSSVDAASYKFWGTRYTRDFTFTREMLNHRRHQPAGYKTWAVYSCLWSHRSLLFKGGLRLS